MPGVRVWLLGVLLLGGCGDDADPPRDAGVGADTAAADAPPAGPDAGPILEEVMPPALPVLGPCPAGWRTIEGEIATCDPWPATGRAECAAPHEAHFPGAPGCAPVG